MNQATKYAIMAWLLSFTLIYAGLTYASYLYLPEWPYLGGPGLDEQFGDLVNATTLKIITVRNCFDPNTELMWQEPCNALIKLYVRTFNESGWVYELITQEYTGEDGELLYNVPAHNDYRVEAYPACPVDNPTMKSEALYDVTPGYVITVHFSWDYTVGGPGDGGGSAGPGEPAPGHAHLCCRAWLSTTQGDVPTNASFTLYCPNGTTLAGYGHEIWFENLLTGTYTIEAYHEDTRQTENRTITLADGEIRYEDFYFSSYGGASWLLDLAWNYLVVPLLQARLYVSLALATIIAWQVKKRKRWRR